jgi:pantothenate kinase type III
MICTAILTTQNRKKANTVTAIQFDFPYGYVGAIVTFAKAVAKQRKCKLVPVAGTEHDAFGPVLVECRNQERRADAEWLGDIYEASAALGIDK